MMHKLREWLAQKVTYFSMSRPPETLGQLSHVEEVNAVLLDPISKDDLSMVELDEIKLTVLLNRAAEAGAVKALQKVGLSDPDANKDIHDLRNLLDDFRSAKKTISTTVVKTITVAIIGLIAAAIWFDFGNPK